LKKRTDFTFKVRRGRKLLRNADVYLPDYILAHPRRQQISNFLDGNDVIMYDSLLCFANVVKTQKTGNHLAYICVT